METGEPVLVEELLQERRDVVANPDGSFTATEYVQPVRVHQDGDWADADPTLGERSDGRLSPEASTIGLSLSNGGDGPLATLTRAGKELELDWPTALPEPTVDGDTATYPQVLPGVDLVVRAGVDGFSQVLVVQDAEAAAQPEITELQMGLAVDGLQVQTTDQGGIEATDTTAGGAVFEAPTPLMWDSGTTGEDDAPAARSAQPAETAPNLTEGPLESSKVAEIDVTTDADTLTLVPDETLLQAEDTTYPVYIDPVWKTSTTSAWAMVSSGYRTTSYWKFSGSNNEGAGRCPQLSGDPYYCNNVGVKRLFYRISTSAYAGKQIISAEFAVTLRHTYDSTARAARLYRTGGITSSTNWSNQPSWTQSLDTKSPTTPAGSCTRTNQNVRFNAKPAVEWAASGRHSTTTFGLRSVNEDSYTHWKRFCNNAQLEVNYNTLPDQPRQSELQLEPGGACIYGTQRPYVDEPPRVSAYLRDPDHSTSAAEQVRAQFRLFWTDAAGQEQERTYTTSYKAANSRFYYQVPDDIPENTTLGWIVRAHDGHAWGPWSWDGDQTRCEFIYDSTAPSEPIVTSWEYPANDFWQNGAGYVGYFTFETPSEDVQYFRYGFNENPSDNNIAPAYSLPSGASTSFIAFTPERTGPFNLTVEAVDRAGKTSVRANHLFLVAPGNPALPHYPLDEAPGSESAASLGDENSDYTAQVGPGVTFGEPGPQDTGLAAASFDGTDGAYLEPGVERPGHPFENYTWSAWVRLDDLAKDQTVVSLGDEGTTFRRLAYHADTSAWRLSDWAKDPAGGTQPVETYVEAPHEAQAGEWVHIAAVGMVLDKTMHLYINGQLASTAPASLYAAAPADGVTTLTEDGPTTQADDDLTWEDPQGFWQIGRSETGGTYTDHLDGALSDVRVFRRMVLPHEVPTIYNPSADRLAYWNFSDEVDGASPEANGGQNMTLNGDASLFYGDPFEEAALVGDGHLNLTGQGHAATATGVTPTDTSFTLSMRARLASATPEQDMSVLSQAGQAQSAFDIRYSAQTDRWELVLTHADENGANATRVVNDLFAPSSEQSGDHLAVVYDAFSREIRFYVNGQLSQTSTVKHSAAWASSGPLSVGRSLTDGQWGAAFSGAVDDVRVYRGAADASLIIQLANLAEQPDL
ncbi:LamG-like jellyroll fold domain-containing protein [Nocardiopsis sp. CC223A]|uniref:LamG-like jellyroll fold domain-containing protein n=1 Tax=Nocardiopsis sp. CC223A TaxID=3044051 RepID=UPI0027957007|nr:LamG-like jellyroll fold domain-containing protein [Nocardiopsis sp. CC223A]